MFCANERARTQWQFGDWEALSSIELDNTLENSEVTELALLRAIGMMQLVQVDEAVACFKDIHRRDLTLSSPPDDILLRKQAFSCKEGGLESFIDKLNIRKYGATLRIGQ